MRNRNYMDDAISNARRERQKEVLAALYATLGASARDGFTVIDMAEVAELSNLSGHATSTYVSGLDRCDVIKADTARVPFRRPSDGQSIEVSRRRVWLFRDEEDAFARLNELYDQERRTRENLTMPANHPNKTSGTIKRSEPVVRVVPAPLPPDEVTLASDEREETRAIVGPSENTSPFEVLRPLRKDEHAALIEATRQYASRKAEFAKTIDGLRKMGIEIDDAKLDKAVRFPSDARLDALSEILPYVERLERTVENLTRQLADARTQAKDYAEVKQAYERLKIQFQRKVAEQVAAAQR